MRISDWSSDVCSSDLCILTFADIKEPIWPASHRAILLARIHAKMLKHVNRYFVRIEWQGQLKISHLESPYRWVQKDSTTSLLCGNSFSGVEMTDRKSTRLNSSH